MSRCVVSLVVLGAVLAAPAPATAILGPTAYDFADTRVGESTRTTLTFKTGRLGTDPAEPVSGVAITGSGAAAYTVVDDRCSGREITSACVLDVVFSPKATGPAPAELAVTGADATARTALTATAYETGPRLTLTDETLRFPSVPLGQISPRRPLTVSNDGDRAVTIQGTAIRGPGANDFVTAEETCAGARLEPRERCSMSLAYAPNAFTPGGDADLVLLTSDGVGATVELKGQVVVESFTEVLGVIGIIPGKCKARVVLQSAVARRGGLVLKLYARCATYFRVEGAPVGRGRPLRTKRLKPARLSRSFRVVLPNVRGRYRLAIRSQGALSRRTRPVG